MIEKSAKGTGENSGRFTVGMSAEVCRRFTEYDVAVFAAVSGDRNPIHQDEEYARDTRFGRRIVQGILAASLFSQLFAEKLPGPGAVYVRQDLRFLRPIYFDEEVLARVELIAMGQKGRLVFRTTCWKSGELAVEGEAEMIARH